MNTNMVKDFLVMSLKHKTKEVNWEELGTNASLLPLIYMIVMAPGLLAIIGIGCFIATGVTYLGYGLMVLGGSFIALGALLIIVYRVIIKHQFKMNKLRSLEQKQSSETKSALDNALAPFLKQLIDEHRLFLNKTE